MSFEGLTVEGLAEVKKWLEAKLAGLEAELKFYRDLLSLLDRLKPMEATKPEAPPVEAVRPEARHETMIPIRSKEGKDLGTMYVGEDYVRIVPSPAYGFKVTVSPFEAFFKRRLEEMRSEDLKKVEAGSINPEDVMEYQIVTDGELLREILVKNVSDERRIRELRSSIRWTFERMLERMKA